MWRPGLRGTDANFAASVSLSSEGCQIPLASPGGRSGSGGGGGEVLAASSLALAAARELSLLIWLGDFFFLLKTFFTSTCCWSGSPRLQVKLRLALPCLHWMLSAASCLDDQHEKNSINEAKTNPCSEFLSNIAAILI